MSARARQRALRAGVVAAGLLPLAALVVRAGLGRLGANPVEAATHATGDWALRCLLLSLAVTPLRRWLGWSAVAPLRRTFGLLAFGYASLHFAIYLTLDLALDFGALGEDLAERPYIAAGFTAFSLLVPLAATSSRAAMRRLGRRWIALHRLVYVAATAAVVHYLWLVKADRRAPLVYAALLAALLAARAARWGRARARAVSSGPASASSARSSAAPAPPRDPRGPSR